jgi:hypothetical protein
MGATRRKRRKVMIVVKHRRYLGYKLCPKKEKSSDIREEKKDTPYKRFIYIQAKRMTTENNMASTCYKNGAVKISKTTHMTQVNSHVFNPIFSNSYYL